MTDCDRLRAPGARQDAALCRRYAFRVGVGAAGVFGFVAYGILWAFLVLVVEVSIFAATNYAEVDHVLLPVAFVLAWMPFALWARRYARRRVDAALPLFEKGHFYDGKVIEVREHVSSRSRRFTFTVAFSHEGAELRADGGGYGSPPERLAEGALVPVLYLPGHSLRLTFPVDGKLCVPSTLS